MSGSYEQLECERVLLKALLEGPEEARTFILRRYRPEHFNVLGEVFSYVQEKLATGQSNLATIDALAFGPFSDPVKGVIVSLKHVGLITDPDQLMLIGGPLVDAFAKQRFMELVKQPVEKVQSGDLTPQVGTVELRSLLDQLLIELDDSDRTGLAMGHNADLNEFLSRVFDEHSDRLIESGFKAVDRRAGGISRGDLVVFACPSSHGKTLKMTGFANNLMFNIPDQDLNVLYITLEVPEHTIWHRSAANQFGIPFKAVKEVNMPEKVLRKYAEDPDAKIREVQGYREQLKKAQAVLFNQLVERKVRFEVKSFGHFSPMDLLRELAIFPYDAVIIDYLNLVDSDTTEATDWLRLSRVARQFKDIAVSKNIVIATAQQLDAESMELRYARAVKEHCDIMMAWVVPDEVFEAGKGLVDIYIKKGRNIGTFTFQEEFNLVNQTFTEITDFPGLDGSDNLAPPQEGFGQSNSFGASPVGTLQ